MHYKVTCQGHQEYQIKGFSNIFRVTRYIMKIYKVRGVYYFRKPTLTAVYLRESFVLRSSLKIFFASSPIRRFLDSNVEELLKLLWLLAPVF